MISPEARERLASLMDDRRLELGLRWRDVAEAGGISYEALRDVRNGTGGIRRLTEHAIETGLQWERGSVARILAGGELDPQPQRRPAPLTLAPPAPDDLDDPLPPPPPNFLDEVAIAKARPVAGAIWQQATALRRAGADDPPGSAMFGEGTRDGATWDDFRRRGLPLGDRAWYFGALIAHTSAAGERGRGAG